VAADHGDAAFENVGRYVVEQRSVDVDAKRLLELGARIDLDFNLDEAVDGLATVFFGAPGVDQATADKKNRPIAVDSRRNRAKSKLAKFSFEIKSAIF
jgi:hypothetical protein